MMKSAFIEVLGSKMHYIEAGEGDPILFLHGIPTSSYVWRNILPHLASLGRCIAPDLIGFGQSDKPDIQYTVADHITYIEALIETLNLKKITLVMHGWGSVIGFDYAMRHEKNCRGLVFYEAFVRPLNDEELSLPYQEQLVSLQDQLVLADIASNGILFIDKMITQHAMRQLTEDEMTEYRKPFLNEQTGQPIVEYLKELPTSDADDAVNKRIAVYSKKLMQSLLPKLMLYSVPGFITTIETIMWARDHLPNIELVDIGEELHLAQESCPDLMGETISVWLQGVESMHA